MDSTKQSTESATSKGVAVIIDDGEILDLSKIDMPTAMRVYPLVNGMARSLKRMIELDMGMAGATQRVVPGVTYEFRPTEEWEVRDPVRLRTRLKELAKNAENGILEIEVDEAVKIVVTGKADNHKLNTLAKRSRNVERVIEEHRARITTPARLKVK